MTGLREGRGVAYLVLGPESECGWQRPTIARPTTDACSPIDIILKGKGEYTKNQEQKD